MASSGGDNSGDERGHDHFVVESIDARSGGKVHRPVTFTAGKTVLGTAQLSSGKATFTTSTLAVGTTTITATYYGDSNIAQRSASLTQTVH